MILLIAANHRLFRSDLSIKNLQKFANVSKPQLELDKKIERRLKELSENPRYPYQRLVLSRH